MNTSKRLIRIVLIFAIITLISLFLSALALTDIYHNNEPDLITEWNIVRLSFLLTFVFVIFSSIAILKIRKK